MPRTAPEQQLTARLRLREEQGRASVLVERPMGLLPVVHVVFGDRRSRSMLDMLGGRRLLDVTVQPGVIARVVTSEAIAARRDGNAWCSAIEAAVARVALRHGMWRRSESAPRGLVPLLTGLGFPILASVYDLGAQPIAEVPRWAERVLAQPSAREAAAVATRLLLDAAERKGGIEVLLDTLELYRHLRHQFPNVPPGRLDTLRDACRELATTPVESVTAVGAHHRRAENRRRPTRHPAAHPLAVTDRDPEQRDVRRDDTAAPDAVFAARNAPATRRSRLPVAFLHPVILTEMEHATESDFRLVLPHSPPELASWGHRLSNCLASYAYAVAAGTSWVVGIERAGTLVACVEIDPATRRVRQLLAAHNRRPSPELVEATLHLLAEHGVIRAAAPV